MVQTARKKAYDRERMQKKRTAQSQMLSDLIRAVEFYADPKIYEPHPHGPSFDRRDVSYVAREVLKKHVETK